MIKSNDLWHRYKNQSDENARQQLITDYAYLTKYVVDRMNLRPSAVVGYDDMISHAIVGLIDAVEKFDPSRDNKFETYAVIRIKGSVLDALKSLDWIPRSVRSTEMEMRRVFASLEAKLGRPATDEEVAEEMGTTTDKLNSILADIGQSAILSLEELMTYGEESSNVSGMGCFTDLSYDPAVFAEMGERRRVLAQAIDSLPDREKLVISLYYKDGLTLKEIAAVIEVTESRVCQLHSKAVVRLQGKLLRHSELLLAAA